MKKNILILLLLIPTLSQAQNCLTTKDPKTGNDVKTGMIFLTDSGKVNNGTFVFSKLDGKLFLQFTHMYSNLKQPNLDFKDLRLSIKFNNNEEKKFIGNSDTRIYPLGNNGMMLSFVIDLTDVDVIYFKKNLINDLMVYHQGNELNGYNTKISLEDATRIIKCTDCVNQ